MSDAQRLANLEGRMAVMLPLVMAQIGLTATVLVAVLLR
jgi:hypothetical protein